MPPETATAAESIITRAYRDAHRALQQAWDQHDYRLSELRKAIGNKTNEGPAFESFKEAVLSLRKASDGYKFVVDMARLNHIHLPQGAEQDANE